MIDDTYSCISRYIGELDITQIQDRILGDVCICNGVQYIYDGTKWQSLGDPYEPHADVNHSDKMHPTHCKCCGAPLHGWKCEYCGVEY